MRINENSPSDIINKQTTKTRDKTEKAECGK